MSPRAAASRLRLVAPAPERPLLREVLGVRLRRARLAQGRSLREVAGDARVSTGHLSQVERGLAEASSEVLRALCQALGLPMSALLRAVAADLAVLDLASAPTAESAPAARGVTAPASAAVQARAA